jgi:MFS superfamily sulfate permease-like transporter
MTPSRNLNRKPQSVLPVLQELLPFEKVRIGPDIIAGITLAALGIPEVMGYNKTIGTSVITGLYTLFLPVLMFALFGSSRHLVVAADSATAAIVAAGLASLHKPAPSWKYPAIWPLLLIPSANVYVAPGTLIIVKALPSSRTAWS